MSNGTSQWFNDRRFTFNGPQRLRENVSQILNDLNHQIAQDNPELLTQLADQFQRLQDVLHGRRIPATAAPALNNNNNAVNAFDPLVALASSSNSNFTAGGFQQHLQQEPISVGPLRINTSGRNSAIANNNGSQPSSSVVVNIEFDNNAVAHNGNLSELGHRSATVHNDNEQENSIDEENQRSEEEPSLEQEMETVRRSPEWQRLMQATRNPDIQKCLKFAFAILPFLFIVLLKVIFVHLADIFRFTCLVGTFFYAERAVFKQVSAKKDRSKLMLLWIGITLAFVLFYFGYIYSESFLHLTFSFQTPVFFNNENGNVSLLTVLWVVMCTDLAAKHVVLLMKCILALMPSSMIAIRRKTGWYQWTEFSSHMYRHWLPLPIWWAYLRYVPHDSYVHYAAGNILAFCYVVLKVSAFRSKFRSWYLSSRFILRPVPFGSSPKTTDLMQAGPTCSICYADFMSPVQLICKHIFCEECVSTWLDKERTCPICRAEIGTDDRSWRDGSTSYSFQFC